MSHHTYNSRWQDLLIGLVVIAVIVAASISLVRFRNRHRADTQAVGWALEELANVAPEMTAAVFAPQRYGLALKRFRTQIEEHQLPVDSVRQFYQEYALHARDGTLDADDLRALGPYFGLQPNPEPPDTTQPLTVPRSDTTSPPLPEPRSDSL